MEYKKYQDELTYLQKTALEGEIALLIASSGHDAEIIYKMYMTLSVVPKNMYPLVLSCFRNMCDFPEDVFTRIRNEVNLGGVPLWIWQDKCVADLKESLKFSSQTNLDVSTNVKKTRLKLVESAFILFCKKIAFIHPTPVIDLCQEILHHNELEFLHTACTVLIRDLQPYVNQRKLTKKLAKSIMECSFDVRDILCFNIEYNQGNRKSISESNILDNVCTEELNESDFEEEQEPSRDSIREGIENIVVDLFKSVTKPKKSSETPTEFFFVTKYFHDSEEGIVLKSFSTYEEANEFKKEFEQKHPELLQTCSLVVEHGVLQ